MNLMDLANLNHIIRHKINFIRLRIKVLTCINNSSKTVNYKKEEELESQMHKKFKHFIIKKEEMKLKCLLNS